MIDTNVILFFVGLLLFLSVLASSLARFGPPLLLIFLIVGMLAGEDGPGQINFNNVPVAYFVANLALAVILLDGGLRTHFQTFRVALRPALSLATFGVLISATLAGAFIAVWLNVDWRYGLLLGSIVASTDAAAVFSQLRNSGVTLNQRVSATLEIESGTNDPMAIFLVTFLLGAIESDKGFTPSTILSEIAHQFGIGIAGGIVLGYVLSFLISRLRLVEGLYALLIVSGGLMAFTAINQLGGSGFLGIYVVGLVVGNRRNHASEHVFRVMDGLAWLAQAGMFLVLGLLVNPNQLWDHAGSAALIALFLIFVARPVAVWMSLLPFHFPSREQGFIAWVGLRGAVPIVLSLFPLMADLEGGQFLFDITFAVVLVSLLIQGTSLAWMARLLKLQLPREPGAVARFDFEGTRPDPYILLAFRIQPASSLAATQGDALARFDKLRCIAVTRGPRLLFPKRGFVYAANDLLYLITPERHAEELSLLFRGKNRDSEPAARAFFGSFILHGNATMAELATVYGVTLEARQGELEIADYMRRRLRRRPVEGDVVDVDGLRLTVRTLDAGVIETVGLRLREPERPEGGKKPRPRGGR
ncbi:potassium transporter [Salinisphaera orenii MK-B5]|uniref:Potassium transporter n=1 Tax=Salinisphaera orenii MK-B5 TaxID=856730 RepID=A0A423PTX4_9GAMM|nr:potassium/proton antiporter [Salinisphaera orenii]ROO29011.1 potassium transporter [Salinisphaera orenii MK-B5]